MMDFCEDQRTCRHAQLLQYLGEAMEPASCKGRCDNCLSRQGHNPHSAWYSKVGCWLACGVLPAWGCFWRCLQRSLL